MTAPCRTVQPLCLVDVHRRSSSPCAIGAAGLPGYGIFKNSFVATLNLVRYANADPCYLASRNFLSVAATSVLALPPHQRARRVPCASTGGHAASCAPDGANNASR